jgi:hypothetical protein
MHVRRHRLIWILIFAAPLLAGAEPQSEETREQKVILTVDRIWDRAGHSAFTDLIVYRGDLYCTFREGSGHIPGLNGVIRVLRSRDGGGNWESAAMLEEQHVDLRDPKLSITPDGRLMVNTGASYYHGKERLRIESRVAFAQPTEAGDLVFTPPQKVILPPSLASSFDWLWRITWHGGWAWGCVQQVVDGQDRGLHLVKSRDGVTYEHVSELNAPHPSETTLRFLPDETLLAMIRCEGNPAVGRLGTARPPYTEWKIVDTEKRFGGPNLTQLPSGAWLAGSRGYHKTGPTTELWRLDPATAAIRDVVTLPSGGDNSYPGFVVLPERNRILVSYYSSHEGNAAIYLAILRLDAVEKAIAETP